MGACSSCLGFGRRDRGVEVCKSRLPSLLVLTHFPCALRTPKPLVFCTTTLTARNTGQPARLEFTTTNKIRNHFDERQKRWRASVTICLSKLCAITFSLTFHLITADLQHSDVVDVSTLAPQSGQANSSLISPQITSIGGATPTAKVSEEHTIKEHEPAPQEMTYRSVRAAPSAGRIWNDLSKDPKSWEAAKAVMEGSGERG